MIKFVLLLTLITVIFADRKTLPKFYRTVETSLGTVRGYLVNLGNDSNSLFYGKADVFLGIPYAMPPVDQRRFKRPEPIQKFTSDGTPYEAIYQRPICPQLNFTGDPQSEDCLTMNIFSPNVDSKKKYPVMLYIHAGHLRSGSASECGVNGIVRNLVSRGVVVVIIQYRLGTLGFFTTMDEEFPPNLGMLDQVEAIKFVHKHIDKFGGDPKQLTLFGESAGAASISAHTYSPMTKELFHKAILQSGSIYLSLDGVFGMSRNSHAIAKSVCNIDLPTNKTTQSKLKKCMMEADATKFLLFERASFSYFLSQKNCQHQDELISQNNALGWKIAVDGSFLPGPPSNLTRPNIPIIIGTNKDEWSAFDLYSLLFKERTVDSFSKQSFEQFFRHIASYLGEKVNPIMNLLLDVYKPADLKDDNHTGWLQVKSDILTAMGFTAFTALEVMSYLQNQNPNVFLYEFNHYSAVGRIFEVPGWQPVPHTAELPFVLMQKPLWDLARLKKQMTQEDCDIADFFGRVWTNFARTGIKCNADDECPRWNATVMKCNQMPYLEIAAKRRMMPDYRAVDRATILGKVMKEIAIGKQLPNQ